MRNLSARRRIVLTIGFLLGLLALPVQAQQSVFDDVDECDLLAAHPSDPERVADGLADDAIVPRLAIMACEAAAKRQTDVPRFAFQLGRAYSAANRRKEATAQFQAAADQGYGAALAYLGDAYQFGHGIGADVEKALDAYRKAAAKGFTPAEGQIEMLTFDPSMYVVPAIALVYAGDVNNLRSADTPALEAYLFSFVMALGSECGPVLPPRTIGAIYNRRYPQSWTPDADAPVNISVMGSVAEYDAKSFLRRHGCEGPITGRVKDSLNRFYAQP